MNDQEIRWFNNEPDKPVTLKGTPWDVNLKKKIYIKLYSLLILTKNTKKSKNNLKAPEKSEIVIFPGRIQNKSAIYNTLHHIFPRIGRSDQSNCR